MSDDDDDRIPDTDPAPATSPDHDAPEPSLRQVVERHEETRGLLAELVAITSGIRTRLDAIDASLSHLVANEAMTRGEEHRHGTELAHLRASVDGLACRQGGNGHVPPGCPEAAE